MDLSRILQAGALYTGGVGLLLSPAAGAQTPAAGNGPGAPATQTARPAAPAQSANPTAGQGAAPSGSQAGTGSGQAAAGATRVHGAVADPDGAAIPGATVAFTPARGAVRKTVSGPDGNYSLTLAPGSYSLLVSMKGFSTYAVQNLRVGPVAGMTVDAKLQIGEQNIVVNVDANAIQLSVDPDAAASSTTIQGKDLEALSDDPDELQSELSALAGPAAGPNGGQIYVDGFTGGQLPPKSSIREIRINQNPFSAQYDRIGYGRVEVFTKPGTDKYHGNFQINGNPSQFNSGNPLSGAAQPPYHTLFMFGSITGPINKTSSFSVGGSHRDIEDDELTNAVILAPTATGTTLCAPDTPGCVPTTNNPLQIFTHYPQVRTDISPRFDFAFGEKNVLTARFQYVQNDAINAGLGSGLALPSNAYNSDSKSTIVQLSDTQTFSSKLINETRFEYEREHTADAALSNAPQVVVQGEFTSGGATLQDTTDHQDHFEVQNYTSLALSKNFIRFGGRLRTTREATYAAGNTNGTFTYADLTNSGNAQVATSGNVDHSYATGTPSEFLLTKLNTDDVHYLYEDLGLYAEDDWKPKGNLTVSYGIRYETQNNLPDHHDFAPRLSVAYGVGKSKTAPTTVLRAGFGIFYDRFGTNYLINTYRYNGLAETLYTVPVIPAGSACSPSNVAGCTPLLTATGSSVYTQSNGAVAPRLRSPYIEQFAVGFDQQVGRHGTVSVNYLHSLGVHELNLQDAEYPTNGSPPPNSVNNQYFSEGQFHQDQLNLNGRTQLKFLTLSGFYSLGFAKGDSSGAGAPISVPYDIQADFGRTLFDRRNFGVMFASVTLPHFIQLSPFLIGQSGTPYNVTLGSDPLSDSYFNERPEAVPLSMANGSTILPIRSCGLAFAQPGTVAGYGTAPINACTGPNLFSTNLRLTKTFGFGEKIARNRGGDAGGGPGGPGGPGGGGRGGGPGGGGPGGGGRGGFGGTSTGRRYSVGIGVIAQNLFGNTDPAVPVATLDAGMMQFGRSLVLQGGPYTQQSAVRRVSLQASFNF